MLHLSNGHSFEFAAAAGALAWGRGWWWERYGLIPLGVIDPSVFTIITKTITCEPREGNLRWYAPWRCVRPLKGGGWVNAVGLTNPGMTWWLEKGYHDSGAEQGRDIILSIAPDTPDEARLMAMSVSGQRLRGIEVNVSCPNSEALDRIPSIVSAVASNTYHPVGVKLGLHQPYVQLADALASGKSFVEWISLTNAVPWAHLYPPYINSPLAYLGGGGVSGMPITVRAYRALTTMLAHTRIPIIAGGGITTLEDVETRLEVGARAVAFGTLFLSKPWRPNQIVRAIQARRA